MVPASLTEGEVGHEDYRYRLGKKVLAGPRGFEPLILRLRAACSTGLSYGPTMAARDVRFGS